MRTQWFKKFTLKTSLSVYRHARKTHTDTKHNGGISIQVFKSKYAYSLLYVAKWLVRTLVCLIRVWLSRITCPTAATVTPTPYVPFERLCNPGPAC